MKERIRSKIGVLIVVLCVVIAGGIAGTGMAFRYQAGKIKESTVEQARVFIYTYGKEIYMAEGTLEVIQKGWRKETVMELNGKINKVSQHATVNVEEMKQDKNPVILTIYMENKIYGFYSGQGFYRKLADETYTIVMDGFLEGYSDESGSYSS